MILLFQITQYRLKEESRRCRICEKVLRGKLRHRRSVKMRRQQGSSWKKSQQGLADRNPVKWLRMVERAKGVKGRKKREETNLMAGNQRDKKQRRTGSLIDNNCRYLQQVISNVQHRKV